MRENDGQVCGGNEGAREAVRRWLTLSVVSLLAAGLLSISLMVGRVPPFSGWLGDPLFFKRALVVHVDLALLVWFYAFGVALFLLLPSGRGSGVAKGAVSVAAGGVGLMLMSVGIRGVEPVLANYVPVLDHPVFLGGLAMFAVGVGVTLVGGDRLYRRASAEVLRTHWFELGPAVVLGLRAMAVVICIAFVTLVVSWFRTDQALEAAGYYEVLFWGFGHVLQVAGVVMMLSVWLILLRGVLGREVISERWAQVLFGALVIPQLMGPWLALQGTSTGVYRLGFTKLMQFGIFPAVLVFLGICLRILAREYVEKGWGRRWLMDPRLVGFFASGFLTVLGFVLGAMIRGSNTMVPAHYHAALGAVTISLMTVTFVLMEPLGMRIRGGGLRSLARFQPLVFGVGQVVFALGFAIAGANGMGRKTYASEQVIRSTGDYVGLVVMGTGGLLAVVGGLLFLVLFVAAIRPRWRSMFLQIRSLLWKNPRKNIPFKS